MLDFFVIFSKSGIVLFTTVQSNLNQTVNKLVRNVILEERTQQLDYDNIVVQYRLDNEFQLVFVVGYQKILTLTYVDKFLDDIQRSFRDKYADYDLRAILRFTGESTTARWPSIIEFTKEFDNIYNRAVKAAREEPKTRDEMRTFDQSKKSQKTVASMIIKPNTKDNNNKTADVAKKEIIPPVQLIPTLDTNGGGPLAESKMAKLIMKQSSAKPSKPAAAKVEPKKKTKEMRTWGHGNNTDGILDFSEKVEKGDANQNGISASELKNVASLTGGIERAIDMQPDLELEATDSEEEEEVEVEKSTNKSSWFGSVLKTINYNKVISKGDLEPTLLQLRDHLISKNVAADIATKLCESVSTKLEGQTVSTFTGLRGFVRNSLEESILRILSPNRNMNILRDVQLKKPSPYVITFVGVNGVGKSTNLAKITNWLIVNDVRVLIVACDTFRAGAIEQLRTHVKALKSIHEADGRSRVELYDKGYGKDPAGIAMEAIAYARNAGFGCCLVDTAGRMQDNEPLMKQLAKLIKINEPDLTLFVGEALVGNEAVDQLTKFNRALLDNGCRGSTTNSSAINGIVLTKFDTIDDQVGAAISMTYITGQPIVFVGVGQTYRDLKQLNAKAVVKALLK